jgi:hypothetical protein
VFCGFPQSLKANTSIKPQLLSSESFSMHYSPVILPFDAAKLRHCQRRQMFHERSVFRLMPRARVSSACPVLAPRVLSAGNLRSGNSEMNSAGYLLLLVSRLAYTSTLKKRAKCSSELHDVTTQKTVLFEMNDQSCITARKATPIRNTDISRDPRLVQYIFLPHN